MNGGELVHPGRRYAVVRLRIASFDDVHGSSAILNILSYPISRVTTTDKGILHHPPTIFAGYVVSSCICVDFGP
jgi:hypothetical protein